MPLTPAADPCCQGRPEGRECPSSSPVGGSVTSPRNLGSPAGQVRCSTSRRRQCSLRSLWPGLPSGSTALWADCGHRPPCVLGCSSPWSRGRRCRWRPGVPGRGCPGSVVSFCQDETFSFAERLPWLLVLVSQAWQLWVDSGNKKSDPVTGTSSWFSTHLGGRFPGSRV